MGAGLLLLQVFDDVEEDGDVVEITAGDFHKRQEFSIPPGDGRAQASGYDAIAVTGIQDGGEELRQAHIDGKSIPLPG
ncbi:MAG: hypothetical protein MZV64_71445 [Ignavibacteriales bacterium]|nr:hypothetical protein [Ignavibacteriales bacterium]